MVKATADHSWADGLDCLTGESAVLVPVAHPEIDFAIPMKGRHVTRVWWYTRR